MKVVISYVLRGQRCSETVEAESPEKASQAFMRRATLVTSCMARPAADEAQGWLVRTGQDLLVAMGAEWTKARSNPADVAAVQRYSLLALARAEVYSLIAESNGLGRLAI
jgi:hypothetical protein